MLRTFQFCALLQICSCFKRSVKFLNFEIIYFNLKVFFLRLIWRFSFLQTWHYQIRLIRSLILVEQWNWYSWEFVMIFCPSIIKFISSLFCQIFDTKMLPSQLSGILNNRSNQRIRFSILHIFWYTLSNEKRNTITSFSFSWKQLSWDIWYYIFFLH